MSQFINGNKSELSHIKPNFKSWCGICYKLFDSSPKSQICQDHARKGDCDLLNCMKNCKNCLRKFANLEDGSKHNICIKKEDLSYLDENMKIQNFFKNQVNKNSSEDSSLFFKKFKNNNNPWESKSEIREENNSNKKFFSINEFKGNSSHNYNSNTVKSKLDSIFSLDPQISRDKNEKEQDNLQMITPKPFKIEGNYINIEFNKYHGSDNTNVFALNKEQKGFCLLNETIVLNNNEHEDQIINKEPYNNKIQDSTLSLVKDLNKLSLNPNKLIDGRSNVYNEKNEIQKEFIGSQNNSNEQNLYLQDQTTIEEIFDEIYKQTKIAKNAINKVKSAFKKRGWNNAKIIRLLKEKHKNWDFLYDLEIKNICPQSEAICLLVENLLKRLI